MFNNIIILFLYQGSKSEEDTSSNMSANSKRHGVLIGIEFHSSRLGSQELPVSHGCLKQEIYHWIDA